MSRFVELSHKIVPGMKTYPGLPEPQVDVVVDYEASRQRYQDKAEFYIASLHLCGNTGTYVDAPFHRYEDGRDVAGYALDMVADLPGVVVRVTGERGRAIDASRFSTFDVTGKAVLVHTGWDAHWRTDTYSGGQHPFLTREAAEYLVTARAALVGIDSLNIDDDKDGSRPAHTALLGAGVAIVEHMANLGALPDAGFHFYAVPPRVKGMGSFPVRAFARLPG